MSDRYRQAADVGRGLCRHRFGVPGTRLQGSGAAFAAAALDAAFLQEQIRSTAVLASYSSALRGSPARALTASECRTAEAIDAIAATSVLLTSSPLSTALRMRPSIMALNAVRLSARTCRTCGRRTASTAAVPMRKQPRAASFDAR